MYIRFLQDDRELLPLNYFDQRPQAGDVLIVEGSAYTILDRPARFEKKAIMTGTVVWGLTLQVGEAG